MSRIAIVGAGNLGSFLAAHLSRVRHDVYFCVRRPIAQICVEGLPPVTVPFYLDHPPPADILLLSVKTHDTPSAMSWLRHLCSAGQPVAVIQNGVHHAERVAPFAAIPVLSYVYVESHNGTFHAFEPPRPHFTVPVGPFSQPFVQLFAGTKIQVREQPGFHNAAWRKMLHNCVANPLTTLARRGLEILADPFYQDWAERILDEALPIARADGADLTREEGNEILRVLASYPKGTRTSMLQDSENGKQLELEALNVALIDLGRRYGLPTPANEELVRQLKEVHPLIGITG
jgi:2-dehydropantoate 2-reductase